MQRTRNLYRLVTIPKFYRAIQWLLGAEAARRRYVREVLKPEEGMKVLDCGCGPASIFPYLPKVDYLGVDLNPNHIAFARAHYGDQARFLVGDVTRDLTVEAGTFDLVMISAILHHLADADAKRLLATAVGLAKPGGRVVTMDSIWLDNQHPVAWAFNKLDSGLHVRSAEGYLALVSDLETTVDVRTYRDFFRVPYDHFCMTLTRKSGCLDA